METLTQNEYEIMSLFWSENRPLSKSEVVELTPQKSWKPKSVHVLLNSLLDKHMIEISGFIQTATNYGRTFVPSCSQEDYLSFLVQSSGHPIKLNAARLFSSLHSRDEIDEATLAELAEIIQSIKGQKTED